MYMRLEEMLASPELRERTIGFIRKGYVFVYPTDTVYGLGCDATKAGAVGRIRTIKDTGHPFSVIAPSKAWISEKMLVKDPDSLEMLPGPYTLILRKRELNYLSDVCSANSLGVRIPEHPFRSLISEAGVPFVTTSANRSGQPVITSIDEAPKEILRQADVVIDGGRLSDRASSIIDLTGPGPVRLR